MTLALHPAAAGAIGLTRAQRDCLLVVQELTDLDGIPPSFAEIAREMSITKGAVCALLDSLEERGWIERAPQHARSIVVKRRLPMPADVVFVLPERSVSA